MMLMGWGKFLGLNIEYLLGKGKNPIWRKIVAPGRTRCSGVWSPVLRRRANPTEGPEFSTLILEVFNLRKKSLHVGFEICMIFVILIFRTFQNLENQPNGGSRVFNMILEVFNLTKGSLDFGFKICIIIVILIFRKFQNLESKPNGGSNLDSRGFYCQKKFGSLGESLQFWFKRFIIFVIFIFRQFRFLETQPNRGSSSFERSLLFQFSN